MAANLPPAPLAGLTSSHTYTPTVGEALGRIVAKTLPNSPLNAEVLAQAFVSLNPKAFSGDAGKRTLSAATLKVPNHNQLVQLVLAKNEAARPTVLAALAAPEPKSATAPAARAMDKSNKPDKRENWVRYAGTSIKAALNFDGSADERSTWVHYLGAAVQRVMGGGAVRAETQQWVHYPRVAAAVLSSAASALPGAPEASADTRTWVRYSAGRSNLAQPSAPLFD
jgi:Tfp pilus assembly protein FimV